MKTCWLIGASEGIGEALAIALSKRGYRLALSARNAQKLDLVRGQLSGDGHLVLPIDVTDIESVMKAWQQIQSSCLPLDRVIYNAGTYEPMDAQHFNLASVEQMLDVNFTGALRVLSFVLPEFISKGAGHIALVGSVAGYRGLPASMGYGASKAALIHLAENLKADLEGSNIKVQIINPGFVATRLTAKNSFKMPFMISPEKAAGFMVNGLDGNDFEIHFPKRFSYLLKTLSLLPASLYFWCLRRIKM